MTIPPVRGMKDILPPASAKWVSLEAAFRDCATRFGFSEIRTRITSYNVCYTKLLRIVDNAVRFLRGNYRDLLKNWKSEMTVLAREMRFEEAARMRDRIDIVRNTLVRQRVVRAVPGDVDAVGWMREGEEATAAILHIREGRLSDASYNFV